MSDLASLVLQVVMVGFLLLMRKEWSLRENVLRSLEPTILDRYWAAATLYQ